MHNYTLLFKNHTKENAVLHTTNVLTITILYKSHFESFSAQKIFYFHGSQFVGGHFSSARRIAGEKRTAAETRTRSSGKYGTEVAREKGGEITMKKERK